MSDWFEDMRKGGIYVMSSLPFVGDAVKAVDNARYYSDYLNARGMSWRDVEYPSRLHAGSMSSPINFVSKNIARLYK